MKFIGGGGGGKTLDTGRRPGCVTFTYAHMMLCICKCNK